jgi:hypothetical protein
MTTHPHISAWLSTALWPLPARAPSLSTHNHGARHYIDLGIGEVSLAATTAELAQLIEGLSDVLGQVRIADMRAAMQPLPEVAG